MQAASEKLIPSDISSKLGLLPEHSLLEIGCGPGALLCPLASQVAHATGVDSADMLVLARERCRDTNNVGFVQGRFPQVSLEGTFDRILIYSVLHYLSDFAAVVEFIDAAIRFLQPGGRILLGDLPNIDKRTRFRASGFGTKFEREWQARMHDELKDGDPHTVFDDMGATVSFNDQAILDLLLRYRGLGYNAYVLPQPSDLPYGYTREDVLIHIP